MAAREGRGAKTWHTSFPESNGRAPDHTPASIGFGPARAVGGECGARYTAPLFQLGREWAVAIRGTAGAPRIDTARPDGHKRQIDHTSVTSPAQCMYTVSRDGQSSVEGPVGVACGTRIGY
jgi:hypothetical protein